MERSQTIIDLLSIQRNEALDQIVLLNVELRAAQARIQALEGELKALVASTAVL